MLFFSIRSFRSTFVLILLLSFVAGCKKTTPLDNGELQTDISGKAGSKTAYSVKIAENVSALLVQASGSEDVYLEMLDSDDNVMSVCASGLQCVLNSPSADTYKINIVGSSEYNGGNLVASWVGDSVSVLNNGIASKKLSGIEGTMHVKSIGLPIINGDVTFTTSIDGFVSIDVLDVFGLVVHSCDSTPCVAENVDSGDYFVRATGLQEFVDITLTVSWGGIESSTLENGEPLNLSGIKDQEFIESFYIPENIDGFMVNTSGSSDLSFSVVDADGISIGNCDSSNCFLTQPDSGLYYVHGFFNSSVVNAKLTAIWGGVVASSLNNGELSELLTAVEDQAILQSLYIPENTASLYVQGNYSNGILEILDESGNVVEGCGGNYGCYLLAPAKGLYYLRAYVSEVSSFQLTAAWGGEAGGTLQNGQLSELLTAVEDQAILQSLYIPENTASLYVQGNYSNGILEILDESGNVVEGCSPDAGCSLLTPTKGLYYIRAYVDEDVDFTVIATW